MTGEITTVAVVCRQCGRVVDVPELRQEPEAWVFPCCGHREPRTPDTEEPAA